MSSNSYMLGKIDQIKRIIREKVGVKSLRLQLANLSLYLLASLISSGVSVMINPFLAANLSPNDYAIIGYYLSFNTLFLPLISFSLMAFFTRQYYLVSKEEIRKMRDTIITIQLVGGFVSVLLLMLVFTVYTNSIDFTLEVYPFLHLALFSIFFSNFYTVLLTEKRLSGKARSFFIFTMINLVINVFLALYLVVYLKEGAYGRMLGLCITSFASGAISLYHLKYKFVLDFKIASKALRFSWPMFLSGILFFLFGGVDRVLLERINDSETLGIYNVAFQITAYLAIFGTALMQTFDPELYKATAKNRILKALGYMGIMVICVFIISLIFVIAAHPIINILTYGRYLSSVPYAKILVFRNVMMTFAFVCSGIIIGLGYPKVELYNRIIGSILAYFIYAYLISNFTFYGAAWGQSITLFAMGMISLSFILYKFWQIRKINSP